MSTETTIVSLLQSQGLTAYPGSVPVDGVYPNVVYQRISTEPIRTHDGDGLDRARFQLTAFAKTYKSSLETADKVKLVFDYNTTDFELSFKEGERDLKDVEANLYQRILDYFIWVRV